MTKYIISFLSALACMLTPAMGNPPRPVERIDRGYRAPCPQIQRPQIYCPTVPRPPVYCPPIQRPIYIHPNYNSYRSSYYNSYRSRTRYCDEYKVEMYSGGRLVRSWIASGRVRSESSSDGFKHFFTDKLTGRPVEVTGDVVITQR